MAKKSKVGIIVNVATKKAEEGVKRLEGGFRKLFSLKGAGILFVLQSLGSALGTVLRAVNKTLEEFKNLEESTNAVNVAFGDGAEIIHEFAKSAPRAVGLSRQAFNQLSSNVAGSLQTLNLESEALANTTILLSTVASDLASVYNTDVNQALEAIQSGLTGMPLPLRRFSIELSKGALEQTAFALGIDKTFNSMSQQEKIILRILTILNQSKEELGDFINTSDSLANKQKINAANMEQSLATLGAQIAPLASSWETFIAQSTEGLVQLGFKTREFFLKNSKFLAELFGYEEDIKRLTEDINELYIERGEHAKAWLEIEDDIEQNRKDTIATLEAEIERLSKIIKGEEDKADILREQNRIKGETLNLLDQELEKQGLKSGGRLLFAPGSAGSRGITELERQIAPQAFDDRQGEDQVRSYLNQLIGHYARQTTVSPTSDTYFGSKVNL